MSLSAFSPHAATPPTRTGGKKDQHSPSSTSSSHVTPALLGTPQSPALQYAAPSHHQNKDDKKYQHLYVLPVLLLEFLAIALTRAVLPAILLQEYGNRVYLVLGCADCVRGLLAFCACPLFGKLSDIIGRRICLLVTVMGTCAPVCSLALFRWNHHDTIGTGGSSLEPDDAAAVWSNTMGETELSATTAMYYPIPPNAITVFVVLLALSGIFSSTFTLVFAYISDTVHKQDDRVSAYGLALATFGLSFTIGPMAGGYLAQEHTQYVFLCSFCLTVLDVLYIYFILPESRTNIESSASAAASVLSSETMNTFSWSPWNTVQVILTDPFLRQVGKVAFLYYTGLWAIISTLSIYAVQRFHLSPERLGELMSALGLSTMVAEAVLVRIVVPLLGEKQSTRLGLISFALQCFLLGFAYEGWHLFFCVAFSMLGNLVYPSLSSLVSGSVEPDMVGEALGAINGVKALTEGIGPLLFGSLMTISEGSALPGWPYIVAGVLVLAAYHAASDLPDPQDDDEYIHELEYKHNHQNKDRGGMFSFATPKKNQHEDEDEYQGLLSEIDEESEDEEHKPFLEIQMRSLTFASIDNMKQSRPGVSTKP
jgi:DHA1 family tetracycline resistance protein-like MFS transporter